MHPRFPLAFLAARAPSWFMVNLSSTNELQILSDILLLKPSFWCFNCISYSEIKRLILSRASSTRNFVAALSTPFFTSSTPPPLFKHSVSFTSVFHYSLAFAFYFKHLVVSIYSRAKASLYLQSPPTHCLYLHLAQQYLLASPLFTTGSPKRMKGTTSALKFYQN